MSDRYFLQCSNTGPTKKTTFSIMDTENRHYIFGPKPMAWARDEITAGKILKMLNGEDRATRACCCRCRCQS
jgi:hypothetical protein